MKKICKICKEEKTLDSFAKHWCTKDRLEKTCKKCRSKKTKEHRQLLSFGERKNRNLIASHNITLVEYTALLIWQNSVCAICGEEEKTKDRSLAVDHDHATGYVRGLLCGGCNKAIGLFKDDVVRIEKAIGYLDRGKI